jgi:DNA-binding LacI/PurR family transcriptional regulator
MAGIKDLVESAEVYISKVSKAKNSSKSADDIEIDEIFAANDRMTIVALKAIWQNIR